MTLVRRTHLLTHTHTNKGEKNQKHPQPSTDVVLLLLYSSTKTCLFLGGGFLLHMFKTGLYLTAHTEGTQYGYFWYKQCKFPWFVH